ncbi:MAG: PilT/PilU family type 4a pilus ATPase [Candidatus Aureabacteria bacterium]|nr:PilT/PilU family type 4a pilus ATPase [Candidatus Auribacterota bacterium]
MVELKGLLRRVVDEGASDLHLRAGCPPIMRLNTALTDMADVALTARDMEAVARSLMNEEQWAFFQAKGEQDFAYILEGVGRFRANVFRQRGMCGVVLRHVKARIPNFQELGLPPILEKIALSNRGVVIVSGATGSGKSTTLASMINLINSRIRRHIITIEDPIEYLHSDNRSLISQREVGIDTRSFGAALRNVMRQDPDIVMIGELRDRDSFAAALGAADVGRLVFATLHSPDAAQVVLRIMDFFPVGEREGARLQFAANLRAIICQRLLPRGDGKGLIPAVEILLGSPVTHKFIREGRIDKLPDAILDGRDEGMQTFNNSLVELVKASIITEETAFAHSSNPEALKMNLQGIFLDESRKILGED